MKNSSYGEAIKQLEALQSRFPFSEPARQAQIDLIYAYYKNREVDPAIDAADTFIRENPTNPRVDYAYYMKGLVYFERQANFMERWFNVDLSQRPPINAKKSFDAFDELLKKYPHSQYVGDARQRMIFLRNRLADFELHVAHVLHEARRLRRRAQPRQVLHRELRRRAGRAGLDEDSGRGLPEARHDGSRGECRARVRRQLSAANQTSAKKSWWRQIL